MTAVREVLAALRAEQTQVDEASIERYLDSHPEPAPSHWVIRVVAGVGAWFAAALFLFFVATIKLFDSAGSMMAFGIASTVAAVVIRWRAGRSIFIMQFALALVSAGQLMAIAGAGDLTNGVPFACWTAIALSAALLTVYRDRTQKFISICMAVLAAMILIHHAQKLWLMHPLLLAIMAALVAWWELESRICVRVHPAAHGPIGFGLAISLLSWLVFVRFATDDMIPNPWVTFLLVMHFFGIVLFSSMRRISSRLSVLEYVFLSILILAIGYVSRHEPGIPASLALALIGQKRGRAGLVTISALFLAFFLISYYYEMELTLLEKSGILSATGAVLLAARFVFVRCYPTDADEEAPDA